MTIDSILSLSPGGVLKLSTLDTTATVRLGRIDLQVLGAMCKAIVGDPTTKELRLASHAQCLPVESWPPVAVIRARKTVTVRVRR